MAANIEVLSDEQCLARLSTQPIGRVSVTKDALPVILPVNFVTDGTSVVFRTPSRGLLAQACDDNVVAFEVDDFSTAADAGWSVLIVGVARLLSASEQLRALTLGLVTAAGDDCDQFIGLRIGRISGREIHARSGGLQGGAVDGAGDLPRAELGAYVGAQAEEGER